MPGSDNATARLNQRVASKSDRFNRGQIARKPYLPSTRGMGLSVALIRVALSGSKTELASLKMVLLRALWSFQGARSNRQGSPGGRTSARLTRRTAAVIEPGEKYDIVLKGLCDTHSMYLPGLQARTTSGNIASDAAFVAKGDCAISETIARFPGGSSKTCSDPSDPENPLPLG